jgi:hypothetical protein
MLCKTSTQGCIPLQKNKNISIAQFPTNNTLEMQFHLPLSEQAYQEYQSLQDYFQTI